MSRGVLSRMIALLVVTLAGFYYIAFDAVGIKLTDQPFTVHVVLPSAGLIYSDASVTYRGVAVGKVSAVHLERDRVIVDLAINHGEKIPANSTASVRELTAAAEQYMDLVPANVDPPYLTAGYTIPESRTSIPVTVGTVLNTVNALVNSLHASDLNTISNALAQGLQGAAQDLRSIIVDSQSLLSALQGATPGTVELIDQGNTVLSTFNSTSDEFAQFSRNLNLLTQQVAASNSDLVALLHNGATASVHLDQFLQKYGSSTVGLINNLATVSNLAFEREPAIRALFQVLPLLATDVAQVTSGGQIRFELTFNTRNTVCPYTSTMLEPTTLVAAATLTGNCSTEAADLLQRGADKAPPPQG